MKEPGIAILTLVTLLSLQNANAVSSDGDSLSDAWERVHGFSLDDDGTLFPDEAPGADPDHDGETNFDESEAATNPFDPSPHRADATSEPGFSNVVISSAPTGFPLSWWGIRGKYYRILVSSDLSSGGWDPAAMDDGTPFAFSGNDAEITFPANDVADLSGGGHAFFRIQPYDLHTAHPVLTDWEYLQLTANLSAAPGTDPDGDGAPDEADAVPFDGDIGAVGISISVPATGSQVN